MSDVYAEVVRLRREVKELNERLNTPELCDFSKGVVLEAAHQRQRWSANNDAGKQHSDWFWLVGYLAGKALRAAMIGDTKKALHHCISTAAVLANWHAAITGTDTSDASRHYHSERSLILHGSRPLSPRRSRSGQDFSCTPSSVEWRARAYAFASTKVVFHRYGLRCWALSRGVVRRCGYYSV